MSKLIVGCGYVGHRLARYWKDRGEAVYVSSRQQTRVQQLQEEGFSALVLDVTELQGTTLPAVDTIVFAVGFDRSASATIEQVYVRGLAGLLEIVKPSLRRFIYISSTGVYGHAEGEWLDEESRCEPVRAGGMACLAAEQTLRQHPTIGARGLILRLAGIYGPGRLPQLEKLRRGETLPVSADTFLNLIHVEDVVRVIAAADEQLSPPQTLCVADGQPVLRRDFYTKLAELSNCAPPHFVPPPPGSTRAERARANKRIRNDRLRSTLRLDLCFPSYREGLAALVSPS